MPSDGGIKMTRDITFHYTNEQMVKDLIALTPIDGSVLDAGSGKNKVWYKNIKGEKWECEIQDGQDFYLWGKKIDWVIGNPPYGKEISKWIAKAYQEYQRGATCVLLIPSRTDTKWWHDYIMKADEIRFIKGRLKFGDSKNSAPFPSAIVIFRSK
jgi:hypothetical protein